MLTVRKLLFQISHLDFYVFTSMTPSKTVTPVSVFMARKCQDQLMNLKLSSAWYDSLRHIAGSFSASIFFKLCYVTGLLWLELGLKYGATDHIHPIHMMNAAGQRQVAADLWTESTDLSHKPAARQLRHYIHHLSYITQPENWYSFYHPTAGRTLSWPFQSQRAKHSTMPPPMHTVPVTSPSESYIKPNTHRRRDETVLSRRRRRCEHNSWRLPTDSVDNFETDQTDSIAFDYTNFDKYW